MNSAKNHFTDVEQRELQKLIELKKMKQAAAECPEIFNELPKQEEEVIVPKTFKEKWGNYWYHYKMVTWLGVFVIFVMGWFIKDIFFGPKYDLVVNVASKYSFTAVNEDMEEVAAAYIQDYDGNEKKAVLINEMQVNYDGTGSGDAQTVMVGEQKILAILNAGADMVFILDKQTYDQLIGSNDGVSIFVDFSELYSDEPELVQGDKVMIQQTDLGKKWKMDAAKSEIYLCVRKIQGNVKDNEKNWKKHEEALDFVDNVIKGEPVA